MRKTISKLVPPLLFLVLPTMVVVLCLLSFHRSYLAELERHEEASPDQWPYLSENQSIQLGWAHRTVDAPSSSYIWKSKKKPAGVLRIGVFGCSLVAGDEAGSGFDIASFLEKEFREAGLDSVEVINFGGPGYGMHQSYLLWEYAGRHFELDFVVFAVELHFPVRDETFMLSHRFGPLHARYVLDGADVRLVALSGESQLEVSERYHSLIPPWRYWRYDNRPPMAVRVLPLFRRSSGSNPFYYRPRPFYPDELWETYVRLLRKLKEAVPQLIVVTHETDVEQLFRRRLSGSAVSVGKSSVWNRVDVLSPELYRAPRGHLGPLGNELQAQELFAFLSGGLRPDSEILRLTDELSSNEDSPGMGRLSEYQGLSVGIGGRKLARFAVQNEDSGSGAFSEINDLRGSPVGGLLVSSPPDRVFIPVSSPLTNGQVVRLVLQSGKDFVRMNIGSVRTRSGAVGVVANLSERTAGVWGSRGEWSVEFVHGDWFRNSKIHSSLPVEEVRLEIGETSILRGELARNGAAQFVPNEGRLLHLRAVRNGYIDLKKIPPKGNMDMIADCADGTTKIFPFFGYVREPVGLDAFFEVYRSAVMESALAAARKKKL